MADSLEDLGGIDMLNFEPNWAGKAKASLDLARKLLNYAGSSSLMIGFSDDVPEVWQLTYQMTKAEEYSFIDYFTTKMGKLESFWFKAPVSEFTLKSTALSGSTELVCYRNYAHRQLQGYERVYVVMHSGDILTRKLTDGVDDEDNNEISLQLATSTDRDITVANHYMIGKLLLVRFDIDTLMLDYEANAWPKIKITVRELPLEYP